MSMRPPDSVRMRVAMRSADRPGPGSRFGQEVTMRHLTVCARATAGAASIPAAAAPKAKLRRVVMALFLYFSHDLFRKPVPTFRDHAIARKNDAAVRGRPRACRRRRWLR